MSSLRSTTAFDDQFAPDPNSNDPLAWKICYTENGQYRTVLCEHNSVGDYRIIDPMASSIPLCAAPVSVEPVAMPFGPISEDVRAALLFALWHHQGGSSGVGQPIRFMLGMGQHERMTPDQCDIARRVKSALSVSPEPVITLNGAQLLQALDFIAPDRDTDSQQLECELTISYANGPAGSGYYCYCTDYPDEGAIMLDAEAPAAPVAAKAQQPVSSGGVADRLDALADAAPSGSQMQSDLYAAATVWRKHLSGPAMQQPVSGAGELPTESVLIDGTAYELPAAVAAELLRLHLELIEAEQAKLSGNTGQLDHLPDATKKVEPSRDTTGFMLGKDRAKRIYIAGPMTGIEDFNFPAFNAAAQSLIEDGWHVENPADHGVVQGTEWADYLAYDLTRLGTCGAIYLLPGWQASKGATLEVHIARALGMEIFTAKGAIEPSGNSGELPPITRFNPLVGMGMNPHPNGLYVYYADYERALAQQDADKVDAERYRAWRDAACKNDRTLIDAMFEYQQMHFKDGTPTPEQFNAGIDYALAAIDAARKEQA